MTLDDVKKSEVLAKHVMLLAPEGGSLEKKFRINQFKIPSGEINIFLLTSRMNHSCAPNAATTGVEGKQVPRFAFRTGGPTLGTCFFPDE